MKRTLIRYRTAADRADENERLIRSVFEELDTKSPDGVQYLVLRTGDGTFFHLVGDSAEGAKPITRLEAFKTFQQSIRERCVEAPGALEVTVVGNYRTLGGS
jgi:hypothetical protein